MFDQLRIYQTIGKEPDTQLLPKGKDAFLEAEHVATVKWGSKNWKWVQDSTLAGRHIVSLNEDRCVIEVW